MSYNPNQNYGYSISPNYYMEPSEDYVPDYSDSEALSDQNQILQTGPPNVTDIYPRNDAAAVTNQKQIVANQVRFLQNQEQYMQQYYYENPTLQATRRLTAVPLQEYVQAYDPRIHQYSPITTPSLHDTNYDSSAYRSAHHIVNTTSINPINIPRSYQETVQPVTIQKQHGVKRHPVKVGTPKYYRRAVTNSLYKRPSALCLPIASQPDPKMHKKHKRTTVEVQYSYPQENTLPTNENTGTQFSEKLSDQDITDHKVGSEGDFNFQVSKLEDMFEKFEKEGDLRLTKSKSDMTKFAKFLKPRIPSSVIQRQEKMKLKEAQEVAHNKSLNVEGKDSKTDQSEDKAGDSIERLLNQLKKCELAVCVDNLDENFKGEKKKKEETPDKEYKKPIRTKSFNYQDITSQMIKSETEVKAFERDVDIERLGSIQNITKHMNVSSSRSFASRLPLDDHCALELHRSKSYIVNLIDRALSKELGTVPSERSHKQFNDMSPRKAIDMMNKHSSGKSDKELCLEITSALTDSIISNATAPSPLDIKPLRSSSSTSTSKICCCNTEEPTYIKQLRQLRWGHLKHIQREVRRLEDLERFLDSCSLNPISEI